MKPFVFALIACLLVGCQKSEPPLYPLATPFQGLATDGKHYSMLVLSQGKPLVVAFFHAEHKESLEWVLAAQGWASQEKEWLGVLGVTTVPELDIPQWKMQHPDILPSIGDMDRRIMQNYNAQESVSLALIAGDGTWRGTFRLADKQSMNAFRAALKKAVPERSAQIDAMRVPPLSTERSLTEK